MLVFDDVTPLIRTQRVAAWRDVARRLAHEIKNPLTPIQLSAERMRRHFAGAPPPARALVDECTTTIVGEVESLKALVDEFAQFARMPAPRAVPADLNAVLIPTRWRSTTGSSRDVRIERRFAPALPPSGSTSSRSAASSSTSSTTPIEAMEQPRRRSSIETAASIARRTTSCAIVVADNGPGIPAADRDKLFMPYYSTKRRGSGLGLAIVRRIIAEHGGSIEVGDNMPHGTRFTIELPC